MRTDLHPTYHPVIFVDVSTGTEFPTRSTITSEETRMVDGEEAYVVRVDVSSASHPLFTGEQRIVDTAGRVERFRRRYAQQTGDAEDTEDDASE